MDPMSRTFKKKRLKRIPSYHNSVMGVFFYAVMGCSPVFK
jgi:hypothetical protein